MLSLLPAVLSAALFVHAGPLSDHALLTDPHRHVRTTDRYVQTLFKMGLERSMTFSALTRAMESTDVIVYVQLVDDLPPNLAGRLLMMPSTGPQRYVRVQVATGGNPVDQIALIGHELRHALEVAHAEGVHDDRTLAALYDRIGQRGGLHLYDTIAAQEAGRRVYREMIA